MNSDPMAERRLGPDPRHEPTGIWDAVFSAGERMLNRRAVDRRLPYFVDRFPPTMMALILALLVLTVIDGVLTIELVDVDCQELNPLMCHFLTKGPLCFLFGKYVMTAAGLPVLLIFKNFPLFGTRFRVGYLVPVFVLLYAGLVGYQVQLLQQLK
ncbi:MAG TPA: DUF5658 family protein [Pirellulales bacterium]|nr:DUF5658 family protein [Pirellulales bacterium]